MSEKGVSRRRKTKSKASLLLASLLLILAVGVFGSISYLIDTSNAVTNTFIPGTVDPGIEEEFDGSLKKDVVITNTGNVPAYVRAMIVVTWVDKDNNVLAEKPEKGTDYTMTGPESGWTKSTEDGYYYWNGAVQPGGATYNLITECEPREEKEGYSLSVEILTQSIQAEPAQAVTEAWGAEAAKLVGATSSGN